MTWLAGALAAVAALATSEVMASLVDGPSLVAAVADLFVEPAPEGIVLWAMETFGASQRSVLVWAVVGFSVAIGAAFGRSSAFGTPKISDLGFALFGLLGILAALTDDLDVLVDVSVASLSGAAIGAGSLRLTLARLADERRAVSLARSQSMMQHHALGRDRELRGEPSSTHPLPSAPHP